MKKILLLLVVSGFFLSSGCSENAEYSALFHTVEGTVIDRYGKPLPGINAYIGNYRLTSNADGKFLFNAIQDPYDLQVAYTSFTGRQVGVTYTSLFNEKVILQLDDVAANTYSSNISITLPSLGAGLIYMTFITDLQNFTLRKLSTGSIPVQQVLWVDAENVNAKVIVLIYNQATGQYENYASKDIVLINNGSLDAAFTSGDFNFNPTDVLVSGNIITATGYQPPSSSLSFRFSQGPGVYGDEPINSSTTPTSYSYYIPGNLPVNVKYIIGVDGLGPLGQISRNSIIYDPDIPSTELIAYAAPDQLEPINNATGINYDNYFTFTDGGGFGIYKVTLTSAVRQFVIYTRATSFKIPSFPNEPQLLIGSNENYTWEMTKLLEINNVDELTRTRLINQTDLVGMTRSVNTTFTTQ